MSGRRRARRDPYAPRPPKDRSSGPPGAESSEWPLVGRDGLLHTGVGVLTAAPGAVRAVVVTGPAGVGRTRFVRELVGAAAAALHDVAVAAGRRGATILRRAAGTPAARGIPLGALAALVPGVDDGVGDLRLVQHAVEALSGTARALLVVDDAHLLDPLSLAVVQHLATSRATAMVLAVREGEPDPTASLWKDGHATRLPLLPLGRADVDDLVEAALDGPPDSRTAETLWQLSRGLPLYLTELLDTARRSGAVKLRRGLRWWDGPIAPPTRLAELVRAQLSGLDADELGALETVAVVGEAPVARLLTTVKEAVAVGLERRGLLRVDENAIVTVTHPLHAAVLATRLPQPKAIQLRYAVRGRAAELPAEDLAHRTGVEPRDVEGGPDPDTLLAAARHALALGDPERALLLAGSDRRTRAVAAEARRWCYSAPDEAARDEDAAVGPADPVALAVVDALRIGARRPRAAYAVLTRRRAVDDGLVQAARALCALRAGDVRRAARLADTVLTGAGLADADAPGERDGGGVPLAAAVAALAAAAAGRPEEALRHVGRGRRALSRPAVGPRTEVVTAGRLLEIAEVSALILAGRLSDAVAAATAYHRAQLARPPCASDAVTAWLLGTAQLAAGLVDDALRYFTEAADGLARVDPLGLLATNSALLVMAYGQCGDLDSARAELAALRAIPAAGDAVAPRLLAAAWVRAATGQTARGTRLALRAADVAARCDPPGAAPQGFALQALALHTAVRFRARGLDDRLRALAAETSSPLVAAMARHATAAEHQDPDELDQVSLLFERQGALLLAAEARAAIARGRSGRGVDAATLRAAALVARCGGARTPILDALPSTALTRREEEIARMAAAGLDNQSIATRLVLSVRTIETHLANAYPKLGIHSRGQLATAMATRPRSSRR